MNGHDEIAAAHGEVLVELPLGDAAPDFNLEKAVCSHGLFMMAPNHWDPQSKTLKRPLRLDVDEDETSLEVHISHPPHSIHALHLRVFGTRALTPQQQHYMLSQVRRMLRLSEEENRRVIEFHKVHEQAKERGFGRMFRSPTMFEDIIKCILLCNCQWSRTLNMAQSLCELQAELKHPSSISSDVMTESKTISSCPNAEDTNFAPKTPARKESKRRKTGLRNTSLQNLADKHVETLSPDQETETKIISLEVLKCSKKTKNLKDPFLKNHRAEGCSSLMIGNFPSSRELANLDENFLAKRCNLGYRARRVINFAQEVHEGRFRLSELEYTTNFSDYDKLNEKLRSMYGFGPYTCANVLMCMGYYHVVPSDSETIRHLKQVHAKISTIQTVQNDVEEIYGKYSPFQFLAYWLEMWQFYEKRFGKLSKVAHSSYRLITAANMRPKTGKRSKKTKLLSVGE